MEFTIKIYKERNSVTAKLDQLKEGYPLIIHDSFEDITYKAIKEKELLLPEAQE